MLQAGNERTLLVVYGATRRWSAQQFLWRDAAGIFSTGEHHRQWRAIGWRVCGFRLMAVIDVCLARHSACNLAGQNLEPPHAGRSISQVCVCRSGNGRMRVIGSGTP